MIVSLAKLLIADGGGEPVARDREDRIRQQAQGIIDFETRIANITVPSSQRRLANTALMHWTGSGLFC
jgi:hypothetical protein